MYDKAERKRSEPWVICLLSRGLTALDAGIDESTCSTSHSCRFPYLYRKLKHLAPLDRRSPLHWFVKPRRNIKLDYCCHNHPPNMFPFNNQKKATQVPKLLRLQVAEI